MGEKVYDSRFDGVEIDDLLGKIQKGDVDTAILGEIRYSSKIDNPFGTKYVMCAGQSVSSDDYPNATSILGISSMSDAKSMPYTSLTETPYVEMQNMPFQINDKLIGKIRTIVIPPVGEPTEEDYINMYASMKSYVDISTDGVNWIKKYEFPKVEGEVVICNSVFVVNGELVFSINRLMLSTQTMICNRLFKTSDFENFQVWETIEMNVPGTQTNEWKIKSISYGQGTYLTIFTETVGGQQKAALLKSIDLITWEYATEVFPAWMDVASDFRLTIFFSGNRWLVQFGYTFICDSVAEIDANHIIAEPSGSSIDYDFRQVFHLDIGIEETYFVLLSNGVYSLSYDTNQNKWESHKQNPPSGWGNGEQYACAIPFGPGLIGWVVLGYANHYFKFPSGTEVKTLSYDIAPGYPNYPIKEVFKIGTNLFLVQNDSNKSPYISKAIAIIPLLSNPEIGLNAYIKLKE